tara:strand:- start:480 stop:737 length:258 start_codon:yes stop_codon:yes gene_type:complete
MTFMKEVVFIEPTDKASKKTKERIKQHGSHGFEKWEGDRMSPSNGVKSKTLFRSVSESSFPHGFHGDKRWIGWLSNREWKFSLKK